jgi:hypothetical protein
MGEFLTTEEDTEDTEPEGTGVMLLPPGTVGDGETQDRDGRAQGKS